MQVFRLIEKDEKVLDVGCATGYFAQELKGKNCRVVGIEKNPKLASVAKKFCEKVFICDVLGIDSLPLTKRSFDKILMLDILEHLKDPKSALLLVGAYLRKEGELIISVPNIAHLSVRLNHLFGKTNYQETGIMDRSHITFFTKDSLTEMINKAGLKIERIDYSADFGQVPLLGRFLKLVPKHLQYQLTKFFDTILAVQFIVVCRTKFS